MNYTIEDIHKEDLIIFKEFLKLCEKYNLDYYVIGGTFLGAIRHKGFIPWDDDMDIAMPRKDFEKLLAIANNELPANYRLVTFENDDNYRYYLPRIVNVEKKIQENRGNNKEINLFIDIFPIDGVPNNIILRKIYYFRVLFNRMMISYYYYDEIDKCKSRKFYETVLIKLGKLIPKRFINPKKRLRKIDKLLKSNNYEKSKNIGTIMGAYRTREIVPKEFFGKPTKYLFEDIYITGPEKYDEYLTHMYGDYMTPPKNKYTNQHTVYKK